MSLVNINNIKKIKQNFQLTYFYSDTENGIKKQVWCTLIVYLLLLVIQTDSESKKNINHSGIDGYAFDKSFEIKVGSNKKQKMVRKVRKSRNKSPTVTQISLF